MRITSLFIAATTAFVATYALPARSQDAVATNACIEEMRQENGLTEIDLTRLQAGGTLKYRGQPQIIALGDTLGEVCRRAISFESILVGERAKAAAARQEASNTKQALDEFMSRQNAERNSPVYIYRYEIAMAAVFMAGIIALWIILKLAGSGKKHSKKYRGALST